MFQPDRNFLAVVGPKLERAAMYVGVRTRVLMIVMVIFAGLVMVSEPAYANPTARYRQQIEQFKTMLEEQGQADTSGVTQKDRALTDKWIQEAEVLLANGNADATGRRLRRVEYALDMIRAMVAAANIDTLAEQQEVNFHGVQEQIDALEKEISQMQGRKSELEQELQRARQ